MEIYYSGRGTGNLLARDPETRKLYTIKQGRNNVPDSIAEMLLAKYPSVISTNEEVRTAKVEKSALADDNASLRAKIKELEEQNKKLQLIAVGQPVVDTKSAEKITALESRIAELEKANKEYEELINAPASLTSEKPAHGKKAKSKDGEADASKADAK